ncbi:MAG: AAA family ATPase [Planctomycetaceae bacterium]|nr:AAA family ATPase [Planctomycetaceae bacterium]
MKIRSLWIRNFKGVRNQEILFSDFRNTVRPLTCLIGDNGAGKTTILQAMALVLSLATRKTKAANTLNWHGFLAERMSSLGATQIRLTIDFDEDELKSVAWLFQCWRESLSPEWAESRHIVPPGNHPEIELTYSPQQGVRCSQGAEGLNQFLGRYYIKSLLRTSGAYRDEFAKVGDVFWFDQHRNLGAAAVESTDADDSGAYPETWVAGVEQLREYLVGFWSYHTASSKAFGRDYIPDLERRLNAVFPGRRFAGSAPRQNGGGRGARDFYFLLEHEGQTYDIAEMSSGEQAVFPLIYEFVRLDISRSIVLIDELELHLHPPEQQRLLNALPKLGPDCQFIVSTHSEFLTGAIPNECEVRLEGGSRCL